MVLSPVIPVLALVPCRPCRGTGWRREVARVNVVRRVCVACEGMGLVIGIEVGQ